LRDWHFELSYDVREENVAFLEFSRHFRRHGLPVPEIYAEDLSHGAYLEEDFGRYDAVRVSVEESRGREHCAAGGGSVSQGGGGAAALSGRGGARFELQASAIRAGVSTGSRLPGT
jgi:hypothetical protein